MTPRPRRRERGSAAYVFVLVLLFATGVTILAAEVTSNTFFRETTRRVSSDEALVLAESAIASARVELEQKGTVTPVKSARLGPGRVSLAVEKPEADTFLVTASGTTPSSSGGTTTRRVRVRFELTRGRVRAVDWREI